MDSSGSSVKIKPKRQPRINAAKISERDIERTCTQFLELDGWRSLKTDPVSRREWAKGFGEPGMADYLYIRYPSHSMQIDRAQHSSVMWIEWKSKRGTTKQHQLDWHRAERARGALTLIAGEDFEKTIEGFISWYRTSGLMRVSVGARLTSARTVG